MAGLLAKTRVADIAAQHLDAAILQRLGAGDQPKQGRFADAVRPDKADHAARRDVERQPVERDGPAIEMAQIPQADRRRGRFKAHSLRP